MSYGIVERTVGGAMATIMKRTTSMPRQRDFYRQHTAEVVGVDDLAEHVVRLRLRADEFADYRLLGADEYFGMYIPQAGVDLVLPPGTKLNARAELERMPAAERPDLRWYTVRRHLPEQREVWVDIVRHEDGPGGTYLARAAVGDTVGFREGTGSYPGPGGRQLLVGDETAVPAISAIAESLEDGDGITCLIEVPDEGYAVSFDAPFEVEWIHRGAKVPGESMLQRLRERVALMPDYAWICGEQSMAQQSRRLLVERGLDKRSILFSGYWRLGHPRP